MKFCSRNKIKVTDWLEDFIDIAVKHPLSEEQFCLLVMTTESSSEARQKLIE